MGAQGYTRLPHSGGSASVPADSRRLTKAGSALAHTPADEATIGRIFCQKSGRCVASPIRVFGDIDLAEDAVQEALQWANEETPPAQRRRTTR